MRLTSLSAGECGLKYLMQNTEDGDIRSLSAGECGLKLHPGTFRHPVSRHSPQESVDWNAYTHWWNTDRHWCHSPQESVDWNSPLFAPVFISTKVTLRRRVWIEILSLPSPVLVTGRHSPQESVDWNISYSNQHPIAVCHSPQESVDWNDTSTIYGVAYGNVTLRRRVWIEISA